jgi:hypothetical protein
MLPPHDAIAKQLDMQDHARVFRFRSGIAVEVLDVVGCIDGAVVQDMLVDELCHPFLHIHYRDGCHGGEGII